MDEDQDVWELELIDDELEIPGWIIVPRFTDPSEQSAWVQAVTDSFAQVPTWDGHLLDEPVTGELIAAALSERAASDSLAVLQIWPPLARRTAMCHLDFAPSAALPDWTGVGATVHRIDEPHLGPGLQVATQRTEVFEDVEIDLSSLTFVFDDGTLTFLVSLPETLTPLVSLCSAGLLTLMRNLRPVRASDGEPFRAIEPQGVVADDTWNVEESS